MFDRLARTLGLVFTSNVSVSTRPRVHTNNQKTQAHVKGLKTLIIVRALAFLSVCMGCCACACACISSENQSSLTPNKAEVQLRFNFSKRLVSNNNVRHKYVFGNRKCAKEISLARNCVQVV